MKHKIVSAEPLCKCEDGLWRQMTDVVSVSTEGRKVLFRHSGDKEEWVAADRIQECQPISVTGEQITVGRRVLIPCDAVGQGYTFAEAEICELQTSSAEIKLKMMDDNKIVVVKQDKCLSLDEKNLDVGSADYFDRVLLRCGKVARTSVGQDETLPDRSNPQLESGETDETPESAVGVGRGQEGQKVNRRPVNKVGKKRGIEREDSSLIQQPFNIPQYRFTPVIPDPRGVMLSPWDRAPQLRLADNNLSVSGLKGYRLIRATHGISEGAWYFEVTIREDFQQEKDERFTKIPGCARLGWARASAYIQAPVGYDRFGYSLCCKTGEVVTQRRRKPYMNRSPAGAEGDESAVAEAVIKPGDVLGFYLYLPPPAAPRPASPAAAPEAGSSESRAAPNGPDRGDSPMGDEDNGASGGKPSESAATVSDTASAATSDQTASVAPAAGGSSVGTAAADGEASSGPPLNWNTERQKLLWKDSGIEYYLDEDKDTGTEVREGSAMRFSVNGTDYGDAFTNIQAGTYFPAASLYMGGHVTFNFGPDFRFPPTDPGPHGVAARPICELTEYGRRPGRA